MGMKKALAIGGYVLLLLSPVAAYLVAPLMGWHIDLLVLLVAGAFLAAALAGGVSLFQVLNRPEGGRVYVPTRLTQDPVAQFVSPFRAAGAINVLARPGFPAAIMLMRYSRIFDNPEQNRDRKVMLVIKKGRRPTEVFNPVFLRELFDKLKPFDKSEHVLLLNEHDEFVGYIPWAAAMKDFTGDQAETKIRNAIINVLAEPTDKKSVKTLRAMGGMAVDDCISDRGSIRDAAQKVWGEPYGGKPVDGDPLNGLVLYADKRTRKPIGVLTEKGLLQLVATGA
jgi:hypothetical protein